MIVILMVLSALCGLLSALIHMGALFHFYHATRILLAVVGFYGVMAFLYPMGYILKKTTGDLSREEYRKCMRSIWPRWMGLTVGFLIMYAIANIAFYFITRRPPADNELYALDAKYRTFSSVWLALHFLIFLMLYGCRYLMKYGYPQMNET
jgi:hypothetical protein